MNKSSVLASLKSEQENRLREPKLNRKKILKLEIARAEFERRAKISRLEELERQLNVFKHQESPLIPKHSSTQIDSKHYLDQLKLLHNKAKDFLQKDSPHLESPDPVPLSKTNIKNRSIPSVPLRIPILVPQSEYLRRNKIQPPIIQKILKNGEVCNVYLVNTPSPTYDPMVKAEISVEREDVKRNESILGEISVDNVKRWRSISPKRRRKEDLDLSKPEFVNLRNVTPQMKVDRYNYRDYTLSDNFEGSGRVWVGKRMKFYSELVKDVIKPKASEKKQLEMMMIKEKLAHNKTFTPKRIRFLW